jgi:hypothetical protein
MKIVPPHPNADEYLPYSIVNRDNKWSHFVRLYPKLHPDLKIDVKTCRTRASAINTADKWQRKENKRFK